MAKAFIVTGSRDWEDPVAIADALRPLAAPGPRPLMIHGDARGADMLAEEYWRAVGLPTLPMPAQWARDDKGAGQKRNRRMLDVLVALSKCGYQVSVHAFSLPQSKGTAHMKRIAAEAGIPVVEHGRIA